MQEPSWLQNSSHFRLLVESVQDYAIFMLDPAGTIISWNAGAERIKGYTADDAIGRHFSCFYTDEDRARCKPDDELAVAARDGRVEDEGWRVRKDGTLLWANVVITALRDSAGELLGFAKVTRDLSERKRSEESLRATLDTLDQRVRDRTSELVRVNEELRANEERLRLVFEGIQDHAIFTVDPQGLVTSWNAGAATIYGYTSDEIIGQPRSRFFAPEDVEAGLPMRELVEAAATGRMSEEAWRIRKDGSRFWANGSISIIRDDSGEVRGFVKIVRDLTERKQIETELSDTADALRLRDRAMQAVSQGILITDPHQPDDPIIYASPGFERMTGYASDEIVGRNCRFLQGPRTDAAVVQEIRDCIRGDRQCVVEILNYRKDGTTFWNALFITPVRDEHGRTIHFVGVQADVSHRRNLEDQIRHSQKMEAVGRLAGGVAHDFNNLLTIIDGYCEFLGRGLGPNDPRSKFVSEIRGAGSRAAGLTRQLLAFSRQTVLEPRVLDINATVRDVETMLVRLIGEDVRLESVLDPSISRVRVDPGQIEQVIFNLAVNARDAMPRGGKLTLETQPAELTEEYCREHADVAKGRYVLLAVSDTGTGMTADVRARVFEPFFTTKELGVGTGLGLSTVYGIVKQSEGHIAVYSEPGVGTCFKVYLPAVEDHVDFGAEPERPKAAHGEETILVVEDESNVREIARLALEMNGYRVLQAGSGTEALELAESFDGTIDLLLTDVVMPQSSGRELAEALRGLRTGLKVLYMSGYTDDAVVRHGILQADVAFLQKPFSPNGLVQKVREVLDDGA